MGGKEIVNGRVPTGGAGSKETYLALLPDTQKWPSRCLVQRRCHLRRLKLWACEP